MRHFSSKSGFTLVELLVSIGIFTMMTGVVLARYKTYDTNAQFANASEDIVLSLREAQVYGVGTKEAGGSFDTPYGVSFKTGENQIILFADGGTPPDGRYISTDDTKIQTISWPKEITISGLDCGGSCLGNELSITFKRPRTDAIIHDSSPSVYTNAVITLSDANTGKDATIAISSAGQISI